MDMSIFSEQYNKSIADAIAIGALDSKTDSILQDMMKAMNAEIKKKEDGIQRTLGEILQLRQTHNLILSLVKNHTRLEQEAIDAEKERQRLLNQTDEEKADKMKVRKKSTKKKTPSKTTISQSKFKGDASK